MTPFIVMYVKDFFDVIESKLNMFINSCGAGYIIHFFHCIFLSLKCQMGCLHCKIHADTYSVHWKIW